MITPVSFGLVGYGFGGRYFHAPLLASAPECDLVAVVTSSPERQALVGRELPGVPTFDSLAALADAGAEAVAISTPLDTHSDLTEQALALGLAVVCDKPFARDPSAARRTVERSEELALPVSPYQNRRWDSEFRTVRKLVDDGAFGTITRFESRFERFAPQAGPGASGGGTLLDFGSHLADQALVLLGPAVAVYAELRVRESGLDDDVFVALTHAGGAHSQLWGSWRQAAPGPRFRVTGTEATYVVSAGDTQEEQLIAGRTPALLGEEWGVEAPASYGTLYTGAESRVQPTERGRWDLFYPAFAGAVRGVNAPPVAVRDAVATARVLQAARKSAESGMVIALEPV
jgi:predicted dehydrogenase